MVIITPMESFFPEQDVVRLPPESTRFLDLQAVRYPDGRRLRLKICLTPFQRRPNLDLRLTDSLGSTCASASILEPMRWDMELTLHLRASARTKGPYTLTAVLDYADLGEQDRRQIQMEIPGAG